MRNKISTLKELSKIAEIAKLKKKKNSIMSWCF